MEEPADDITCILLDVLLPEEVADISIAGPRNLGWRGLLLLDCLHNRTELPSFLLSSPSPY